MKKLLTIATVLSVMCLGFAVVSQGAEKKAAPATTKTEAKADVKAEKTVKEKAPAKAGKRVKKADAKKTAAEEKKAFEAKIAALKLTDGPILAAEKKHASSADTLNKGIKTDGFKKRLPNHFSSLKLTEEQLIHIYGIQGQYNEAMMLLMGRLAKLREERDNAIDGVLTSAQKSQLKTLREQAPKPKTKAKEKARNDAKDKNEKK